MYTFPMSTTQRESRKPTRTAVEALNPLGERVRERRKELGLSLEEVAARTNLTASFLSLIERNINNPSLDSLYRIAEALEVPPFYFSASGPPAAIAQNPVVRHDERIGVAVDEAQQKRRTAAAQAGYEYRLVQERRDAFVGLAQGGRERRCDRPLGANREFDGATAGCGCHGVHTAIRAGAAPARQGPPLGQLLPGLKAERGDDFLADILGALLVDVLL